MKIGAHVSTAGGVDKVLGRALDIGAEAVQIFPSSPQSWHFNPISCDQANAYRTKSLEIDVQPTFFHAIYLINLGTQDPIHLANGIRSLTSYMDAASHIGAAGVIFHAGSHKGIGFEAVLEQAVGAIRKVLDETEEHVMLLLENSAGMGHHIGASFQEVGRILTEVANPRLKVCLDTQHSYAAGYNVSDKDGLNAALEEFEKNVGLSNLGAVHANDSKIPLGGGVDRHENIGQGYIGLEGFEVIMAHPAFRTLPFLLEVPGLQKAGPDKTNVDILKGIRGSLGFCS
jgi:deoxyribonuclease-4